jgi:hypothetical protein
VTVEVHIAGGLPGIHLVGLPDTEVHEARNRALRRDLKQWHELAAHALLIIAVVHAMAALVHQFMWRDLHRHEDDREHVANARRDEARAIVGKRCGQPGQ